MNDTIEILAIGSQVGLSLAGEQIAAYPSQTILGLVTAVIIRRDGVSYEVAYWTAGRRRIAIVTPDEIAPHVHRMARKVRAKKGSPSP